MGTLILVTLKKVGCGGEMG